MKPIEPDTYRAECTNKQFLIKQLRRFIYSMREHTQQRSIFAGVSMITWQEEAEALRQVANELEKHNAFT